MEKIKNIDTVIFDLDGTLLYTLEDMADSVNHVMAEYGFPQHSVPAIRSFIGNGIRKLLERALPEDASAELCDEATEKYRAHYQTHCMIKTQPYDGIMEM
ncbi:MAG: HAD hydrolase-like protein, partial [Firmicutes bacterium]|nr:HAD hydrolase-like protein [Bacillota bacterium]